MCKRIKISFLILFILMQCCQQIYSEFTYETCQMLNNNENITCNTFNQRSTVIFNNEERLKIYVSFPDQSFTISCMGTDEDVLSISEKLPNVTLGKFNDTIIDGCIPFDDIFQHLGISVGKTVKVQRGASNTPLQRNDLINLSNLTAIALIGFGMLDENVFEDFRNLEILELTRFEAPMPAGLLAPMGECLIELQMRQNCIKTPPAGFFSTLESLALLDLSYNEMVVLNSDTFEHLYNLTTLDLSNNKLTQLPATLFKSLHNLTSLYISNNRLKELQLDTFSTLGNLKILEMENNALDFSATVACSIFDGLTNLEYLELSNNSLSIYCLPHHMDSVRVKVANNKISQLIVQMDGTQLRPLANLDVRHNRLKYLNHFAMQYLHNSAANLSLAHNPWSCDCQSLLWLSFIKLNYKLIADLKELSCADGRVVEQLVQSIPSDLCQSTYQVYYLVAIVGLATLAVIGFIVACLYRRSARINRK